MSISSTPTGSVAATFLTPLHELFSDCRHRRDCPALPDATWIHLRLDRVLHELPSRRAFLQEHAFQFPQCPPRANYFESLKSARRLKLADELIQPLCERVLGLA